MVCCPVVRGVAVSDPPPPRVHRPREILVHKSREVLVHENVVCTCMVGILLSDIECEWVSDCLVGTLSVLSRESRPRSGPMSGSVKDLV